MKALAVVCLLVIGSVGRPPPMLCIGALHAIVMASGKQERATPKGEWCQRPEAGMPKEAHACGCHKQDCTDGDPNHVSAHTDAMCLNYCTVAQCACGTMDCK